MANRYGTEGNDVIDGSIFGDNIAGYGGDDVLRGLSGDDIIYAGGDDDWMDGGSGADTLYGLSGFDTASYELRTQRRVYSPRWGALPEWRRPRRQAL